MTVKFFSKLFGYSYEAVKTQTTVSRQKIVTLGTLLLIPVFLWTFSGFYLTLHLLGSELWGALLAGLVLGTMIFFVDRSFITTPKTSGDKFLKGFRFFFALVATALGSLTIDLVVFSGDLEEYRTSKAEKLKTEERDHYFETHRAELDQISQERESASLLAQKLDMDHLAELDGRGGTGKTGLGAVAKAKAKKAEEAQREFERLDQAKAFELKRLKAEATTEADKKVVKRSDALMSKIIDLHEFVTSSWLSGAIYFVFFSFVFALEAFFIVYKSYVADSLFEKLLYAEEQLGADRLDTIKLHREEILRQDGLLGPKAERMRRLADADDLIRIA
jgi:hypothetical protein